MIRTVTGLVVMTAAMLLSGCSSESGGESGGPVDSGSTTDRNAASSDTTVADGPMEGMAGDTLCDMVGLEQLGELFGEPFVEADGGINPLALDSSVVCYYWTQAYLDAKTVDALDERQVMTELTYRSEATTAKEALDLAMRQVGQTVDYQPIDGLGAAAGYADRKLNVGTGDGHLAAILEVGGEFVQVTVKGAPDAALAQLRPVMDELLPKVESELR